MKSIRVRIAFSVLLPLSLLVASPAPAALVHVGFEGVLDSVDGALPGGPSVGQAFAGSFFYDPGQSPSVSGLTMSQYDFPAGNAGIEITVAGVTYATDLASLGMTIGIVNDSIVDKDTLLPTPPDDPFAAGLDSLSARSVSNLPVGSDPYTLALDYLDLVPGGLSTLFTPTGDTSLPAPSSVVAQQLEALAGTATVEFDSPSPLGFSGTVTNAFAIPEPATAALLLAGLAALAARRGRPSSHAL